VIGTGYGEWHKEQEKWEPIDKKLEAKEIGGGASDVV